MIREVGDRFNATAEDLGTRISELEKREARRRDYANDNLDSRDSIAQNLIDTDAFKELNGGRARGRASVEMAAITSADTTVGAGRSLATSLVPADRRPGIVTPALGTPFLIAR